MAYRRLKTAGLGVTLAVAIAMGEPVVRQGPLDWRPAVVLPDEDPLAARQDSIAADSADAFTEAFLAAAGNTEREARELVELQRNEDEQRLQLASAYEGVEPRIVVSLDKRWLWYLVGSDTLLSVPVAVGMNRGFEYEGRRFHFSTPRGVRKVLSKQEDPVWTVPEWHYYERARHQGLEVVRLHEDSRVDLSDGTVLLVIGEDVGRINHYGNFWPFTPGNEIIFDGKVFMPPLNTRQRRVPDALGPYKLDTGNGYLIHGTHIYNEESVGRAVSHGCVRMSNDDLERLYWMVDVGTKVIIR